MATYTVYGPPVGAQSLSALALQALGLNRFELLIDWGWFYFITKPLFKLIDWFFHLTGNFGWAILIVTVLAKPVFFSALPNKSYASMAKMKAVQAEMMAIRERQALFVLSRTLAANRFPLRRLRSVATTR